MGADRPRPLANALDQLTQRLIEELDYTTPTVLLLARAATAQWSIALELEGTAGWIGARAHVMSRLSAAGGTVCTICRDPNQFQVLFAHDGQPDGTIDPLTAER
ncbi:hypothetical protein AB0I77_15440 [Streptomyces sp. NPDC050619]|uniref:hypothetical protein n=1 Tax=Streptomyces sp. NPDC050619 TaxID=3157214 RepID=UPI00341A72E6